MGAEAVVAFLFLLGISILNQTWLALARANVYQPVAPPYEIVAIIRKIYIATMEEMGARDPGGALDAWCFKEKVITIEIINQNSLGRTIWLKEFKVITGITIPCFR